MGTGQQAWDPGDTRSGDEWTNATNNGSSEWLSAVIASNSLGDTEFGGWLHKEIFNISKCSSGAYLFWPFSKRTSRECDKARLIWLIWKKKSEMLLVGKLARWAGISGLRQDQVVGRERLACARLGKERRRTHINLGITTQ